MPSELPPFEPVTLAELRRIYSRHSDPGGKRLVLEIGRYRRSMQEINGHYRAIQEAFNAKSNGNMSALHLLHKLMHEERFRTPS